MSFNIAGLTSRGTPAPVLLPLGQHILKDITSMFEISVPVRGVYPPESPFSGKEYDINPQEGVLLFGAMTQALIGLEKYPTLAENELFIVSGVDLQADTLLVVGRVVQLTED